MAEPSSGRIARRLIGAAASAETGREPLSRYCIEGWRACMFRLPR